MKSTAIVLVTAFFLSSLPLIKAQDIQFRLNCSDTACGFSVKSSANDTLFKLNGKGSLKLKTPSSLTNSFFSIYRGNTYIFDIGNYSNRNYISANGTIVAPGLLADTIGTPTPSGDLRITAYMRLIYGGCYIGNWSTCSDIRLKKNIIPISRALDKVLKLQGITFQWRKDEFPGYKFESGENIGFIAQDVEKILPALVKTESDGMKSVNYTNLTAVLVEAIKDQQKIIDEQNSAIRKLESRLAEQQKKIDAILSEIKNK